MLEKNDKKQTMKKLLVIVQVGERNSYRVKRVFEEAKKRNIQIDLLSSFNASIFANKVVLHGKTVEFDKYIAIFSIGNPASHHYLIQHASLKSGVKTWPSEEHLFMNDKFCEGMFLASINIPIPKTILLTSWKKRKKVDELVRLIGGYPCVAKKVTGSEGDFVELIHSSNELVAFVKKFPHPSISGKKSVLLQKYIKESSGTDFRVYCVGKNILGAIKRTSQDGNFKANISLGGSAEQVEVDEEMINYSKRILNKGKFLFAGIDFIKSNKGYLVVEINTSADFHGFEKATGINVAGKILDELIKK